jgi:hypothetical protein
VSRASKLFTADTSGLLTRNGGDADAYGVASSTPPA